ncbi:TatD family hydrolase [bacterium]|nr:TatD family hydrolase [bacterium]
MLKTADTHIHLNSEDYASDWQSLVQEAVKAGINAFIVPGTDPESSKQALAMSAECNHILPAGGIHPHDCQTASAQNFDLIRSMLPKLIAVGEIGLDYHYDFNPRQDQRRCLADNIELAKEGDLPVIIHTRESDEDLLDILKGAGLPRRGGVVHCCSSPWEYVKKYLDMGLYIGITGMATFPKAVEMRENAEKCPFDRLLIETDGPYLAPVPHRGKRCQPIWLLDTAAKIAELRSQSPEELKQQAARNACSLFGGRLTELLS